MPGIVRLLSVIVMIGLVSPAIVQAQNIGGGTPDLQHGAVGSDQPSSYTGERTVPVRRNEAVEDETVTQAPPPPAPRKKKKPAVRKPKPAVVAPTQN